VNAFDWGFACRGILAPMMAGAFCLCLALAPPSHPAAAFSRPLPEETLPDNQLSAADVERYRMVFDLQARGAWTKADELIGRLENRILLGHVLAQRYLHTKGYRSRYRELSDWLDRYADHPDAKRIHKLALKRKPRKAAAPRRPIGTKDSLATEPPLDTVYLYHSKKRMTRADRRKVQRLKRRLRRYIDRSHLTNAERLLEHREVRRLFDRFELDDGYARIAAGWLYFGKTKKAFELADKVAERSGSKIPTAYWTAGLASWRLGNADHASRHFERLAFAEKASAWNRSAGAYWAARVHETLTDAAASHRWLTVAAGYPYTFYGLLAQHRLNLRPDVTFAPLQPDATAVRRLLSTPRGARAAALIQIGRTDLADRELQAVSGWKDPDMARTILALTLSAKLPRLGLEIAQRLLANDHSGWSRSDLGAALYPLPGWTPQDGFSLDRALIYAFIRQESAFDPRARSPDGARGLMQLMPRTASALDRRMRYAGHRRELLYDPALNLSLAQRYLNRLLDTRRVDGDVLRLSVAYNAGLGNLKKWARRMPRDDDPLMFVESVPSLESRLFVERVMTNLWIYRLRLGQPTPTLAALASGRWPKYEALDEPAQQIASEP